MLKFLLTFGAGVYTGIYITQNYDVPAMDNPSDLLEKLQAYLEQYRRK